MPNYYFPLLLLLFLKAPFATAFCAVQLPPPTVIAGPILHNANNDNNKNNKPSPSVLLFANNRQTSTSEFPHQDFERAVACAGTMGLCNNGELTRLAEVLESCGDGCFYNTDDDELCQQEIVDRRDVADILRLQAALQLRQVYLKDANLFKERVQDAVAAAAQQANDDSSSNRKNQVLETMSRAIECASKSGSCSVEELNSLADALEGYSGCLVDDEECEQEKVDRQDVADILRMDAAVQLRQVYFNNVNSFKEAVEEAQENVKDAS